MKISWRDDITEFIKNIFIISSTILFLLAKYISSRIGNGYNVEFPYIMINSSWKYLN
jgi:hypothetical protein